MRIHLIIGPTEQGSTRLRTILKKKSSLLEKNGIFAPDWNHVRLYSAVADPDQVGILRFKRGFDSALAQKALFDEIQLQLETAVERLRPQAMVFSAGQFGSLLSRPAELHRLRALLAPFSDDIRITAQVDEQARLLARHYADRVMEGRRATLDQELQLLDGAGWWDGALACRGENQPLYGLFNDVQHPPFWLDYERLSAHWQGVFGADSVVLRPLMLDHLLSEDGTEALNAVLGRDLTLGKVELETPDAPQAAASVARVRQFNDLLIRYCQHHRIFCPRDQWRSMTTELRISGTPIAPGSLFAVSDHFRAANARLIARFPDLAQALAPDAPQEPWQEPAPVRGFRASQYLTAFNHRIRVNAIPVAERLAAGEKAHESSEKFRELLPDTVPDPTEAEANKRLLEMVKVNHQIVLNTRIKPHNNMGTLDESQLHPAYTPAPPRRLEGNSTGNVIVACMKNEAPYIVEWIAYHRAIGIDRFLIYTNDCTDGTDEVLGRLQDMGIVHLRNNDNWQDNSPQQHALNEAMQDPVFLNADWIIHIDVDEFINIRTGNGTLDDLFAAVPDATNIAMTWRLFGHNGVTQLRDDLVIDQFDTCAPSFCPKPHTVWGFKTMMRNIGAYGKISCHRPNKLHKAFESKVKWVNGSGKDITRDLARNGWRSSKGTIGYDLVQLNHYALRSTESFLIKRQRGRALHVDRSIGINYWIRMDWGDSRDVTIKRNIHRVQQEYDRLLQDDALRRWHLHGLAWHRAKAEELHAMPEFEDLYQQALAIKLNEVERVAYALSLDMES